MKTQLKKGEGGPLTRYVVRLRLREIRNDLAIVSGRATGAAADKLSI